MSRRRSDNESGAEAHSSDAESQAQSEAQAYRLKALEYVQLAKQAHVANVREHLLRMGRSCLLIARNAEWLESTDVFLREWRDR
jgi:hypothetical protein